MHRLSEGNGSTETGRVQVRREGKLASMRNRAEAGGTSKIADISQDESRSAGGLDCGGGRGTRPTKEWRKTRSQCPGSKTNCV